jgi:predicted PurR-regulated permease PerM/phosphoglycolate phosphatase-like HAD superfamily hydrolase
MGSRRWSNLTKIIVSATLVLLVIALLVTFRVMIPPTIVAFLLAFILSYPVNWIQRRTGWPRGATVAVLYIMLIGLLALTPALFMSRVMLLVDSLQTTLENLITELENPSDIPLIGNLYLPVDSLLQETGTILTGILGTISTNPFLLAREFTSRILTVIYVLVLNFWILKDLYKLQRFIMEQVPSDYQEDVRRLGHELGMIWDAFLRGQMILAFVVGSLTWIALGIVGMPNAGGLALLAGFMEFLPTVGPGISGTIGVAVALFSESTWLPLEGLSFALVVLIIYAVIAQYETINLIPRLVGRRVRLHPAVTFVGIISGALVFGLLGVLLATPILASARTILSYVYRKLFDLEPFEPVAVPQSAVHIRGLVAGRKIEAVVFDLDGTLSELDLRFIDTVLERTGWLNRLIPKETQRRILRRLMVALEGPVNFLIAQLRRFRFQRDLERLQPYLNMVRGYAPADQMKPIPDVDDALHELRPNYRLSIVSTRSRQTVEQFLVSAGLGNGMFETIVTREDVRNLMPNSEGLLTVARNLQLPPNSLLVVSDTDVNLRSGRAASMATAGVLTGLGERQDLADDADLVLPSAAELCEWL